MNEGFWRNVSWLLDQMVMAWAAAWISLSLASHSLSYLSLLLFSLRFSLFRLFRLVLPFWTAGFFFLFYIFFLDLHRLLTRLDSYGSSVNETKGAQVFFFWGKILPTNFFFFFWAQGGPGPLRPPPRSVPDFYSNSLPTDIFFPTKI